MQSLKRKHVAYFSTQMLGHINAMLPILNRLVSNSYDVTCPVIDKFKDLVMETGAQCVTYDASAIEARGKWPAVKSLLGSGIERSEKLKNLIDHILVPAARKTEQLIAYYSKNRPDVILYEKYALEARAVASTLGVPAIQICVGFSTNLDFEESSRCGADIALARDFFLEVDSYLSEYGINPEGFGHIENMNISLLTKSMQHNCEQFDSRFHFVGPSLPERIRGLAKENDASEKNVILVSLTTGFDVDASHLKIFMDALSDTPYKVVLALRNVLNNVDLAPLPSNFEVNNSPLVDLFKDACLFVGPGGMTSIFESLSFGIPLVMVPGNTANEFCARRTEALGLGVVVDPEGITADGLRGVVLAALSDATMKTKVKSIQKDIAESDGPGTVVKIIDDYLAGMSESARLYQP